MARESPNKASLDRFIDRMRENYRVEELKNWELDELNGEEWNVRRQFRRFQRQFPPEDSLVQGERRAVFLDDPNDTREALTPQESERLDLAEQEIIGNVKQARGIRKTEYQSRRNRFIEALTELFQWVAMAAAKIRGRF